MKRRILIGFVALILVFGAAAVLLSAAVVQSVAREQLQDRLAEESRLKETQLRMESSLKESQLIFLQSQINPHFL